MTCEEAIRLLHEGDDVRRRQAVRYLGQAGGPAVPSLIGLLESENFDVRRLAAEALAGAGDPRAVPALCAALRDWDWQVRKAAASTLVRIPDPRAAEALCSALDDSHPEVRLRAAEALGKVSRSAVAAEALLAKAGAGDRHFRAAVLRALPRHARGDAEPVLVVDLNDPEEIVRTAAVSGLAQVGGEAAVAPLVACLERDGALRWRVAHALARIARRTRSPLLRQALPALEARLRPWSGDDASSKAVFRRVREQILSATRGLEALPVTSSPLPPAPSGLPIQASAPEADPDYPLPADDPVPTPVPARARRAGVLDRLAGWLRPHR